MSKIEAILDMLQIYDGRERIAIERAMHAALKRQLLAPDGGDIDPAYEAELLAQVNAAIKIDADSASINLNAELAPDGERGPAIESRRSAAESFSRTFSAHLEAMAQRVSGIIAIHLFGNASVARADAGRRRMSVLPGVTWAQDGIEITMASVGKGKRFEVELASRAPFTHAPRAISWAVPERFGSEMITVDRFNVNRTDDARYLVEIKKPDLERRLVAISIAKKNGRNDEMISLSPLVEF